MAIIRQLRQCSWRVPSSLPGWNTGPLRVWLATRLLVARVRFDELGPEEISAFIHDQPPSREAEKIFTDEAIAAIAYVSSGDPVMLNRFSRRMLDRAAASTGNTLDRANLGSATV